MELKTTIERDNVYSHRTKRHIDEKNNKIITKLFFSLASAKADGIKTDHSPSDPNIRTLDIYQVQQLIQTHCDKLITHMEIIDALHDLTEPELVKPSTIAFNSELDGQRIDAIRLIYNCSKSENSDAEITDPISYSAQAFEKANQVLKEHNELGDAAIKIKQDNGIESEADELAEKLTQVDLMKTDSEIYPCDASRSWIDLAMQHEDRIVAQYSTIQAQRKIIIDLLQSLHDADPYARISMTSADILELVHSREDTTDNPF